MGAIRAMATVLVGLAVSACDSTTTTKDAGEAGTGGEASGTAGGGAGGTAGTGGATIAGGASSGGSAGVGGASGGSSSGGTAGAGGSGVLPDPDPNQLQARRLDADGQPLSGQRVVFHAADGSIIAERMTDARGLASVEAAEGSVTFPDEYLAVFDLVGGDRVVVPDVAERPPSQAFGMAYLTAPAHPSASSYTFFVSNGEQQTTTTPGVPSVFSLYDSYFHDDGTYSPFVLAQDGSGTSLAYAFLAHQTPPALGAMENVVLDGGWLPTHAHTLDLVLPPGSDAYLWFKSAYTGGVSIWSENSPGWVPTAVDPPTIAHQLPGDDLFDAIVAVAYFRDTDTGNSVSFTQGHTPGQAALSVDGSDGPGYFRDAAVTQATAGRPDVTWTPGSGAGGGDFVDITLSWIQQAMDGGQEVSWHLVARPDRASLTFPELPAADASRAPQAGADLDVIVEWYDYDFYGGYRAAVRELGPHIHDETRPLESSHWSAVAR